jgi:hypothetical protein
MAETRQPKPGVKSTEFWATIGISGLPIAEQLGWFDKMPLTEGGEAALWFSAGLIASVYVFSRAWVKVATAKYGANNENSADNSTPSNV